MNVLSLDAEYNQPSGKTIQIGAAIFHAKTAVLLGTFETLVNPGEPINSEITLLTGITDKDVENAPTIQEAFLQLYEFSKTHKRFKNPLVWGAGTRNDSQHLYEEAYNEFERTLCPNFMGYRVIDVKSIYQSIQVFNNKSFAGPLKDICGKLGIEFEGREHTALSDAINSFKVWHNIVSKFPGGFK